MAFGIDDAIGAIGALGSLFGGGDSPDPTMKGLDWAIRLDKFLQKYPDALTRTDLGTMLGGGDTGLPQFNVETLQKAAQNPNVALALKFWQNANSDLLSASDVNKLTNQATSSAVQAMGGLSGAVQNQYLSRGLYGSGLMDEALVGGGAALSAALAQNLASLGVSVKQVNRAGQQDAMMALLGAGQQAGQQGMQQMQMQQDQWNQLGQALGMWLGYKYGNTKAPLNMGQFTGSMPGGSYYDPWTNTGNAIP